MTDEPGDTVTRLPVRYLGPLPDRSIVAPWEVGKSGCTHLFVQYIVSEASADVECGACHEKLNPMWVLKQLATHDRRYAENAERVGAMSRQLEEKRRTKCESCGKMTRVRLK